MDYAQKFIQYAMRTDQVSQLAQIGDRINNAVVQTRSFPYEFIVSTSDPDGMPLFQWLAEEPFGPVIQASILPLQPDAPKSLQHISRDVQFVYIFTEDGVRLHVYLLRPNEFERVMEEDSLVEVLWDATRKYGSALRPTDISHRLKKPTAREVECWCDAFFYAITQVAIALQEKRWSSAQQALTRARTPLYDTLCAAVAARSSFTINLGRDGDQLASYAPQEYMQHWSKTYSASDAASLWDALFQACMLFRKTGLEIAECSGYAYPKERDVKLLRLFRTMWEASR